MPLWIFDADNTLYPSNNLHRQYITLLKNYCEIELNIPQSQFEIDIYLLKQRHKTRSSVIALIQEYGIDYNHIVKNTYLKIDPSTCRLMPQESDIASTLALLPGSRVVLTNNPSDYTRRILKHLGLNKLIDHIIGLEEINFSLKPNIEPYQKTSSVCGIHERNIFIDDQIANLETAKSYGWETIHANYHTITNTKHNHSIITTFHDLKHYI